ncbi:hemolysin-III related-domain-containing protein [Lipomyces japonicus]|uniref:hemolysin-III related-domain-containing protein n=1 Tax=Lipomyces japonicus TaxID=56871 RepID=UPI0034CFB709
MANLTSEQIAAQVYTLLETDEDVDDTLALAPLRPAIKQNDSSSSVSSFRRHSFHSHSKSASADLEYLEEIALLKLDLFLSHLEQRLSSLEAYGSVKLAQLDESLINAHQTLLAVKESCGKLGGEVIGESWRRGEAIVNILDRRYQEFLADKDSLPSKVVAGMKFLEQKLSDIESQCYTTVDQNFRTVDTKLIDSAEAFQRTVQAALASASSRLLTYDELPVQWRENPYIQTGYRFYANYSECLISVGKWHNETCNIWTHAFGFFLMLGLALYHYPSSPSFSTLTFYDKFVVGLFLIASLKCLLSSMIWHTFCCIGSLSHKQKFACVDYSGISVLIACSILTTEYTSFYCQPQPQLIYMTATAIFGIVGVIFTWHPAFDQPSNRWLRITFFISLAMSGLLTLIHLSLTRGLFETLAFYFPVAKSLICYLLGVAVYGLLFPEKFFSTRLFDSIGMSHNIWHLAVVGGIYYHYAATHKLLNNAREFSCTVR